MRARKGSGLPALRIAPVRHETHLQCEERPIVFSFWSRSGCVALTIAALAGCAASGASFFPTRVTSVSGQTGRSLQTPRTQAYSVLYSFGNVSGEGNTPNGPLIADEKGQPIRDDDRRRIFEQRHCLRASTDPPGRARENALQFQRQRRRRLAESGAPRRPKRRVLRNDDVGWTSNKVVRWKTQRLRRRVRAHAYRSQL
jgi:hypothetical protein